MYCRTQNNRSISLVIDNATPQQVLFIPESQIMTKQKTASVGKGPVTVSMPLPTGTTSSTTLLPALRLWANL